jgi:hypothetical protein
MFKKNLLPLRPQILSVAQLVEQLTLNQWVPGSNPGGETKKKSIDESVWTFSLATTFIRITGGNPGGETRQQARW